VFYNEGKFKGLGGEGTVLLARSRFLPLSLLSSIVGMFSQEEKLGRVKVCWRKIGNVP
jgi:hypothetical protein